MTPLIMHKTQVIAIGLLVASPVKKLPQVLPGAWKTFFSRQHELTGHFQALRASLGTRGELAYEFLGAIVPPDLETPVAMRRLFVPANRYIRVIHEGPVTGIAASFGRLQQELAAQGLKDAGVRLDIGYSPGLPNGRHELFVGIDRFMPAQLGSEAEASPITLSESGDDAPPAG